MGCFINMLDVVHQKMAADLCVKKSKFDIQNILF